MYKKSMLLAGSLLLFNTNAIADDLSSILEKVSAYAEEENYSKALEELSWAKRELDKKYNQKLSGFLPDTLSEFTGEKSEINSAMGFTNISRNYSKDGARVRIELQAGSGAGAGAGMGGLAALGQMAAMFGQQPGQESMRIKGRTANLMNEGKEMTIFLDGGSMLSIKNETGSAELRPLAEALDLDAIENFMKGK
jgi:hypothetical protein